MDYTLLDRWRHAYAWQSRPRPDAARQAGARSEAPRQKPSLQDEHEREPARVVQMPLAD